MFFILLSAKTVFIGKAVLISLLRFAKNFFNFFCFFYKEQFLVVEKTFFKLYNDCVRL